MKYIILVRCWDTTGHACTLQEPIDQFEKGVSAVWQLKLWDVPNQNNGICSTYFKNNYCVLHVYRGGVIWARDHINFRAIL